MSGTPTLDDFFNKKKKGKAKAKALNFNLDAAMAAKDDSEKKNEEKKDLGSKENDWAEDTVETKALKVNREIGQMQKEIEEVEKDEQKHKWKRLQAEKGESLNEKMYPTLETSANNHVVQIRNAKEEKVGIVESKNIYSCLREDDDDEDEKPVDRPVIAVKKRGEMVHRVKKEQPVAAQLVSSKATKKTTKQIFEEKAAKEKAEKKEQLRQQMRDMLDKTMTAQNDEEPAPVVKKPAVIIDEAGISAKYLERRKKPFRELPAEEL